jgi:hypothetical protein
MSGHHLFHLFEKSLVAEGKLVADVFREGFVIEFERPQESRTLRSREETAVFLVVVQAIEGLDAELVAD